MQFVTTLFRVRVPVLLWLAILAAGPALVGSPMAGLLFVDGPHGALHDARVMAAISAAAFLAAAACLTTFHIILWELNGRTLGHSNPVLRWISFLAAIGAPAVLLASIFKYPQDTDADSAMLYAGALAGFAGAGLVVLISEAVRAQLEPPGSAAPLSLIWPVPNAANHKGVLKLLSNRRNAPPPSWSPASMANLSPHLYAAAVAVLTAILYFFLAWEHEKALVYDASWAVKVPALAWLMFVVSLFAWTLSGISFALDAVRIPLTLSILAFVYFTGGRPSSDYFYRSDAAAPDWARPSAEDLVGERASDHIVLVSAPGGGIQSGAWSTWALWQLEEQLKKDPAGPGRLMPRVAAISSVSGGSVGVFHLAAAGFDPETAYKKAVQSSIDDVAWGWFVPDLQHILLPFGSAAGRELNRGWALETSLESNSASPDKHLFFNDEAIRPDATHPALILNSTIQETGHPIVFSTSKFLLEPKPLQPSSDGVQPCIGTVSAFSTDPYDFWDLYHRRLRVVTAARLSATFPYVSPVFRTFADKPDCADFHLLDGGYFDNYGVTSLAKWLQAGVKNNEALKPRPGKDGKPTKWHVLVIRLFAFPDDARDPSTQGWNGQVLGPLNGVMSARSESQLISGDYIQELLGEGDFDVKVATFTYGGPNPTYKKGDHCASPPLNWVLSESDQRCITDQTLSQPEVDKVVSFVREMAVDKATPKK